MSRLGFSPQHVAAIIFGAIFTVGGLGAVVYGVYLWLGMAAALITGGIVAVIWGQSVINKVPE